MKPQLYRCAVNCVRQPSRRPRTQNFTFHNPVKIVFGRGSIAKSADLVPSTRKVLLASGGGSIRANGVYRQVTTALKGRVIVEFGGIEPNPRYETLLKAVEVVRKECLTFLLALCA